MRQRHFNRFDSISPEYDKDVLSCASLGTYSSVWRMLALSNLLNITVKSVFPPINRSNHYTFKWLNTTFKPPFANPKKGSMTILWTNTAMPLKNAFTKTQRRPKADWCANHFVPLVCNSREERLIKQFDIELPPVTEEIPVVQEEFMSNNIYQSHESDDSCEAEIIKRKPALRKKKTNSSQKLKYDPNYGGKMNKM